MKASLYDVFIERAESVIVYNTLWNSFLVTSHYNAYPLQQGRCSACDYENQGIFKAFVDKKMIIDEAINEETIVRETLTRTNNDPSYFELIINPTLACNFNCWYCYESHLDVSTIDEAGVKSIVSLVQRIISQNEVKEFGLMFFGGEPLLCYDKVMTPTLNAIYPMMQEHGIEFSAGITSNGLLLSKERLSFLKIHGVKTMQITIDGNKNRHNRVRFAKEGDDSYSRIIANIREALSYGINVSVRLNISKETSLDVSELLRDFEDLDEKQKPLLNFSVHKVWQEEESVESAVMEIVREIRAQGYRSSSYYSAPSSIWHTCYADRTNHLTINPDGKVYKCTACDFSARHVEGSLSSSGRVIWNALHDRRLQASPLNVAACRDCSILPICAGGCSQRILECTNQNECPLGMSADDKQQYAYRVLAEKLEEL